MKCSATTAAGRPCKAHAVRGSDPPLCSAHAGRNVGAGAPRGNQNRRTHGFYSRAYTLEELAELIHAEADPTLQDEIWGARVAVLRVMTQLKEQLDPVEYGTLAALVFTGFNTVSRLVRAQRIIEGEPADGIASAIAQALDEIGEELGLDL